MPFKDESLQFLKSPITLKKFHELIDTDITFCEKNLEIIEDKQIQNICGKGKLIVKNKGDSKKFFLDVTPNIPDGSLSTFVTPIDEGCEINFSVNEAGLFECLVLYNGSFLAFLHFNCSKEPQEEYFYPELHSLYVSSYAQLISPLNGHLKIGQRYNFEIKIDNTEDLTIESGSDSITMTKNGNVFKEENVYIHDDTINIYSGRSRLVSFVGIGDKVDYPICFTVREPLKLRLIQPLTGTLSRGNDYTFELRCDSIENIRVRIDDEFIEMDRTDKVYKKTINIDSSVKQNWVYISYRKKSSEDFTFDYYLYQYNLD